MSNRLTELATKIEAYFKKAGAFRCEVRFLDGKYANGTCRVWIERDGSDGLGNLISFANMKQLSEWLRTDEINIENEFSHGGCDTCDYGALSEGEFACFNIDPFGENK
jgi:hypothetical protein